MTKDELLAAIREDRARLEAVVVPLSDARLEASGPDGGWSAQHHLSHIAAWERMIVAHITNGSDAALAGMEPDEFVKASLDDLNARLHDLHAGDTTAEVRAESAAAHAAIVAFIEEMPAARLAETYWSDDPSQRTMLAKISGDTHLHYREHADWIGELISR